MTVRTTVPLVLVDGHNLLWRAALGFPARITSRDGTDLTGTFGFFALLRIALQQELRCPAECIVCFDGEHAAAGRQQTDPTYKANRGAIDLTPLGFLADIQRGLTELGICWVELDTHEADDVIATLTARDPARPTVIVSTDRDYLQLVSDRVCVLNTALRAGERRLGPEQVAARYQVTPAQWCDFRALTGDPADNIPGIKGVGARTAARLLADGGTLEDLWPPGRFAGRLSGRLGAAITAQRHDLLTWRELLRVAATVPVPAQPTGVPTPPLPTPAAVLERLKLWGRPADRQENGR